jgi:glycosyltransferase involved in cell wall biosynthesis
MKRKIVWIGCYPAHYTRQFHCAIERRFPEQIQFIYTGDILFERAYEQGDLPKDSIILSSGGPWKIWRILRQLDPKTILVAGHYPRVLVYGAVWGFIRRRDVLYWADTNLLGILLKYDRSLWIRRSILRGYLGRMLYLLYASTRTRDYYIWACGPYLLKARLRCLPWPRVTSQSLGSKASDEKGTSFQVLYVGRLAPEKAVDRLIKAFALLSDELRKMAHLRIVGDGTERESLEQLVRELSLKDAVDFFGAVPSGQVNKFYDEASVLVLPSHREHWGMVVSEAMASGLPVIAPFWVGSATDLVVNGHTGIVVNDNTPEEISAAIQYLIEHPDERIRMGKASREIIGHASFSLENTIDAFAEITGLKTI